MKRTLLLIVLCLGLTHSTSIKANTHLLGTKLLSAVEAVAGSIATERAPAIAEASLDDFFDFSSKGHNFNLMFRWLFNGERELNKVAEFLNQWPIDHHHIYWIMYAIIALVLISWLLGEFDNPLFWVRVVLLLLISVAEIVYVLALGKDSTWFCSPTVVLPLSHKVANFFIFLGLLVGQIWAISRLYDDGIFEYIHEFNFKVNFNYGGSAILLMILVTGIGSIFDFDIAHYLWAVFALLLLIQMGVFLSKWKRFNSILYRFNGWIILPFILYYLIIISALLLFIIQFIPIIIVSILVILFLFLLSRGDPQYILIIITFRSR